MSRDQETIDKLVARLKASRGDVSASHQNGHATPATATATTLTDQDVLKVLFSETKGAQWESVYNGALEPHYPSASEAVAGLLRKLAFYTQKNTAQMERLIRGSALANPKFDERRGGTTWLGRELQLAIEATGEVYTPSGRSRLVSSSSSPIGGVSDDTYEDDPEVVWFAELGEPKERKYLIEKIGVKGYPIVAFGAGGVAKSFAMLSAGVAIASASGVEGWLGLRVLEHGYVLYLDFELDVDEQHRRVRDLCAGLGVPIPKRLAYLSGVGIAPEKVFAEALSFVKKYEAKAVIIDSMGHAMEGDMERSKDVLAFHGRHVNPLRRAGATPFIVDHEGKRQTGEKHRDKSPFGSAFKTWAARNVLQFELEEHDKESSTSYIRVRQTKTNFAPIDPFGVRVTFEEKKVSIETFELEDTDLVEEESVPVRERILGALRIESATNAELQKLTGASAGTIRNNLSDLMRAGEVVEDGYKGRSKVYRLVSSSSDIYREGDDDDTSDETPGQRIVRMLRKPPKWLAPALERCRTDPDRYLTPTAHNIAAAVFDSVAGDRVEEVRRVLEAHLEEG